MMIKKTVEIAILSGLCLAGCQSPPPKPEPAPTPTPVAVKKTPPKPAPAPKPAPVVVKKKTPPPPPPRKRTAEQIQLLQQFAIKESPVIWKTIQTMRAEMTRNAAKTRQLRADLLEFDRNPDTDEDYKALVAGQQELRKAYEAIFDKLENAYIAKKKYEASPSRKDYKDMMKCALEDGIQDAVMATERYKAMTRQK